MSTTRGSDGRAAHAQAAARERFAEADALADRASDRAELRLKRSLGSPALFAIVYTSVASAIYFSLGVVADRALGLTPLVFLAAGVLFCLAAMTYVEGSSLHQQRAGATVFARHAFDELWSFVAGWAVLLDYTILLAVCALVATNYLQPFWGELGSGGWEIAVALAVLSYVALRNVRGFSTRRVKRVLVLVVGDLALQALIIVLGVALFLNADALTAGIDVGTSPSWGDVLFALTLATVSFTALESAAGLAGEVAVGRRGLRRLVTSASATVTLLYVGIAAVAICALPVSGGETPLGTAFVDAPVLGVVAQADPPWLADALRYVVGALAFATLVAAAQSAMLGLSRLTYSLATHRQIPSAVGRLHPTFATPYVVIVVAALLAAGLVLPLDLEFLVGIYAYGALLAITIAHASVLRLRFTEPDRPRPYAIPLGIRVRGATVPVPALVGLVLSALAFASLFVLHDGARWVGTGWMVGGLVLYVAYRRGSGKSLTRPVSVPEAALRTAHETPDVEAGTILVPILGTPLDDDIVQTAGRLAEEEAIEDETGDEGATIEAIAVIEVPMALPIDAALPEARVERAKVALRRAKAVGEEYRGVTVQTKTVRARRTGQAIVDQARRLDCEAIVMAAEEPSRIARAGLASAPLDDFVGDVTKYVVARAPCRVILTAPAR